MELIFIGLAIWAVLFGERFKSGAWDGGFRILSLVLIVLVVLFNVLPAIAYVVDNVRGLVSEGPPAAPR